MSESGSPVKSQYGNSNMEAEAEQHLLSTN